MAKEQEFVLETITIEKRLGDNGPYLSVSWGSDEASLMDLLGMLSLADKTIFDIFMNGAEDEDCECDSDVDD